MLIEDEDHVLEITTYMLEMLGYDVLGVKTGMEAVDIARTFDGDIDLAILDIGLPDINGKDIYPFLMQFRPLLKAIVCSGLSIDSPAQSLLDAGAQGFLQKPFSLSRLSETLKEILE